MADFPAVEPLEPFADMAESLNKLSRIKVASCDYSFQTRRRPLQGEEFEGEPNGQSRRLMKERYLNGRPGNYELNDVLLAT